MFSDEVEEFNLKGRHSFTPLAGLEVVPEEHDQKEEEQDFYDDVDFTGPMHYPSLILCILMKWRNLEWGTQTLV